MIERIGVIQGVIRGIRVSEVAADRGRGEDAADHEKGIDDETETNEAGHGKEVQRIIEEKEADLENGKGIP